MKKSIFFIASLFITLSSGFAYTIHSYNAPMATGNGTTTQSVNITSNNQTVIALVARNDQCFTPSLTPLVGNTPMVQMALHLEANGLNMHIYALENAPMGTQTVTAFQSGAGAFCGVALGTMVVSGIDTATSARGYWFDQTFGAVNDFTMSGYATTSSLAVWFLTAQSGASITTDSNTFLTSQPEVALYGSTYAFGIAPVSANFSLSLVSPTAQLFRGLMIVFASTSGGGGGGSGWYNTNFATTTLFAPDFTPCDTSAIDLYPTFSLGVFSLWDCTKAIAVYVAFGEGLNLAPINNFKDNASTSIVFFPFNQIQGLYDALNSSSTYSMSLPIFGTSTAISISTTTINNIKLPTQLDETIARVEYFFFYAIWAVIYIVIIFT